MYLFFLFLLQKIDCGYSLEPPRHLAKAVLMCTHNLCFEKKIRKIAFFSDKIFQFLQLKKISVILHGQVFVMPHLEKSSDEVLCCWRDIKCLSLHYTYWVVF